MNGNKKAVILAIVATVLIGLLTASVSFAYWTYTSNNFSVGFNVVKGLNDYVSSYNTSNARFADVLYASTVYTSGQYSTITFKATSDTPSTVKGRIRMKINDISSDLNVSGTPLKWQVAGGTTASGTFNGYTAGSTYTLKDAITLPTTSTTYNIYIWLSQSDGGGNASYALSKVDVEIYMELYNSAS